ncbi:MAG: 5-(carboxyamino)imidazole ribonucleotide mutase [Planctomycetota bacterium]|nr:5-(carboxyamino)imidazole ribonucleotide mutase [Planctomycetota bacterium]MDG1984050.1 5-(carboxyamino)imidazole ribonucleotide mutase [Planctomycetota bacterium]
MSEDQIPTLSQQLPEDLTDAASGGARVSVVFGSASDWPTMRATVEVLDTFGVQCEYGVVSAHRTPDRLRDFAEGARARGVEVIIAAAGGAAHLPGMIAAWTTLPVLGVPIKSRTLSGVDSLLSIVQMPRGVPVGTLAIGEAGASNAALLALRILSNHDPEVEQRLKAFGADAAAAALSAPLD